MQVGERPLPQAGLLFFLYRGKSEGIKSLELIYNGAAGKATLDLLTVKEADLNRCGAGALVGLRFEGDGRAGPGGSARTRASALRRKM